MELNVFIKEEIKDEVLDVTETLVNAPDYQETAFQLNSHCDQFSLPMKKELLPENVFPVSPMFAIKGESCLCTGETCEGCIEAEVSKELHKNDYVACSDDDYDNMPSDWFSGELSDSEEAVVDTTVSVSAASVSNFQIKAEYLPDDEESLPTFASTQPDYSIVVKGETCPCSGNNCLDCLEETAIVDAPVTVSIVPVTITRVTTLKRSSPCPECGKTFAHLMKHLIVHSGERPYVCAQCPKTFKRMSDLKEHRATHQAVRSKPCLCTAEGCGKSFPRKQDLTLHIRSHTGIKPYKCDSCGKGFTTGGHLTRHFRTHTGKRPYKCPLCPMVFSQTSHAKRHQQRAHPSEP